MRGKKQRGFSTTKSIPFRRIPTEIDEIDEHSMGELEYEFLKRSSKPNVNATGVTIRRCSTARNSSMIANSASLPCIKQNTVDWSSIIDWLTTSIVSRRWKG